MTGNPYDQFVAPSSEPESENPYDQFVSGAGGGSGGSGWFQPAASGAHLPTDSELRAFGSGAADAASFGFGDEGAGVLAGIGASLSGGDYSLAYRRRVDEARTRLAEARALHPISTMAGSLAGAGATLLVPVAGQASAARFGAQGLAQGFNAARGVLAGERLLPFASTLSRWGAGSGAGAVLAQGARGLQTGALFGGIYGAGAANSDSLDPRLGWGQGALGGAGAGALLGAVSPALFQGALHNGAWYSPLARTATGAVIGGTAGALTGNDIGQSAAIGAGIGAFGRPVLGAIGNYAGGPLLRAMRNPRAAFGNQTGMSLGIPPIGGGGSAAARGAEPPAPDQSAVRRLTDALHRQRSSADELEAFRQSSVSENAADVAAGRAPIVRRIADTGDELSTELDTVANMPGMSLTRVAEVQRELASALPRELRAEMRGTLGVRQTPGELIDDLRVSAANANDGYGRITSQRPVEGIVQSRILPLMETAEMQPVLARRYRVESGEDQLANVNGTAPSARSVVRGEDGVYRLSSDVTGEQLHRLKVNIDDELNAAVDRRSLSPAGRDEQHLLDSYRDAYLRALDDALPGYAAVRSQRGSVFDAERALRLDRDGNQTIGQRILKMDPEEISRFMNETVTPTGRRRATTPFERSAYRTAVVQDVLQRIDDYISASGDKIRNAGEVFDRVGLQNRLRAVFNDRPAEIDLFLNRAIERAEQLRRASSWTGGSSTARRLSRAGDQMSAMDIANPVDAVRKLGRAGYNALVQRRLENQNNAFGNALLSRLDDSPETISLLQAVRRLQAERTARAREAGSQGAVGVLGSGNPLDEGY